MGIGSSCGWIEESPENSPQNKLIPIDPAGYGQGEPEEDLQEEPEEDPEEEPKEDPEEDPIEDPEQVHEENHQEEPGEIRVEEIQDGALGFDMEVEDDEIRGNMDFHAHFPWDAPKWEGQVFQPPPEEDAKSDVTVDDATPDPVILSLETYHSILEDLGEYQLRVIDNTNQINRQQAQLEIARTDWGNVMKELEMTQRTCDEAPRERDAEHRELFEVRRRLRAMKGESVRLRTMITGNPSQPNEEPKPPST